MPSAVASMVNVKQDFIPAGKKNRSGAKMTVGHITIHNTSNTAKGADAKAHAKFVKSTGHYVLKSGKKNWVSWHFTVDDGQVIQHLPINEKGIHAGGGNSGSIGIEICMNDGIDQTAANLRAATLVAALLTDLKLKSDRVKPHFHWTGKACPTLLLNGGKVGTKWTAFLALVDSLMKNMKTAAGDVLGMAETAATAVAKTVKKAPAKKPAKTNFAKKPAKKGFAAAAADDEEPDFDHEHLVIPASKLSKPKAGG